MSRSFRFGTRHIGVVLRRSEPNRFSVAVDGVPSEVEAVLATASTLWLDVDGVGHAVEVIRRGETFHVAIAGETYVLVQEALGVAGSDHPVVLAPPEIIAPMPGKVLQVLVCAGQAVAAGEGLLVLEAMKMEHRIVAEAAATVQAVWVVEGQMVDGGAVLLELAYD